jgi:hypothetical protein
MAKGKLILGSLRDDTLTKEIFERREVYCKKKRRRFNGENERYMLKYSKIVYYKKKRKRFDENGLDALRYSKKIYCKKKRRTLEEDREFCKQLWCFCYLFDLIFTQLGIDAEEYEHRIEVIYDVIYKSQGEGQLISPLLTRTSTEGKLENKLKVLQLVNTKTKLWPCEKSNLLLSVRGSNDRSFILDYNRFVNYDDNDNELKKKKNNNMLNEE